MGKKVLVGMSGGVDSSATALILKQSGYDVTGVTLRLCKEEKTEDISDAKAVCEKIGIPHITLDLRAEFEKYVVSDFISQYKNGLTPNPCLVCNRYIKFGEMLKAAQSLGFDKIATGHYARVEKQNGRYILKRAADLSKDQSYVLYSLNQQQLSHVLFPLGDLSKVTVREISKNAELINADRPDSQDICFVPDGDYAAFIEKTDGVVSKSGDYVNLSGEVLGRHKGIIHYTIGQRKGLGIALGKPQFVIDKLPLVNRVVLGEEEHLFKSVVRVKDVNFIPFDGLEGEMHITAKLRYRHKEQPAVIKSLTESTAEISFFEPQRAPTPGQAAVFYDGDTVIGGGIII
ncbi:MAG: tRNA 2-thiouridine(34) synthase MnmA [Acutalibacteraceae bacterium]